MYSIFGIDFSKTTVMAAIIAITALILFKFLFKILNEKLVLKNFEYKMELCQELNELLEELKTLCNSSEYELFQIQFEKHFLTNRKHIKNMNTSERFKYAELMLREEILKRKTENTQ